MPEENFVLDKPEACLHTLLRVVVRWAAYGPHHTRAAVDGLKEGRRLKMREGREERIGEEGEVVVMEGGEEKE
jgi:hypothetical protein